MKTITTCLAAAVLVAIVAGPAAATMLFEDVFYWMPDGSTLINPDPAPTDHLVKIQETVWDDPQGRTIVADALTAGTIHGGPMPTYDINLYVYSITNGAYGDGAGAPVGTGITGFNIPDNFSVGGVQWGPTAAAQWWDVAPGHSGPGNWEWDINADQDVWGGDGIGVTQGQTHNGYMIAVPAGTPHGYIPGTWVHAWSGEQPAGFQVDIVYGIVSGPVPVPGAIVLGAMGLGLVGWITRRRKE